MQQRPIPGGGSQSGTPGSRLGRSVLRTGMVAVAGVLMVSCGGRGKSITVDREVFVPDTNPRVDVIARRREGGFVVTGIGVGAWVVATDAQGKRLWHYSEPVDDRNQTGDQAVPQTQFHGSVALANGNTLLCGGRYKSGQTENLLVILDRKGSLVERRVEVPNDDPAFKYSNFYQCFPRHDGMLLLGNTNDGSHGYIWLVELDNNGVKRRQALVDSAHSEAAGTVAGPGFVFTAWDSQGSFRVIKADEKGQTLAKRVMAGEFIVQLRPVVETEKTWLLIFRAGKATLYILDERLQDFQPPKKVEGYFDPQDGRGFVLADGSIVLFSRSANAAIALIDAQGKMQAMREFAPKYTSYSVSDAVSISAKEFVTVRGSVSQDPKDRGLIMSWVTIKDGE